MEELTACSFSAPLHKRTSKLCYGWREPIKENWQGERTRERGRDGWIQQRWWCFELLLLKFRVRYSTAEYRSST